MRERCSSESKGLRSEEGSAKVDESPQPARQRDPLAESLACAAASPVPVADVAAVGQVLVQMWAGVGPVPVQMWAAVSPSPDADMAALSPSPGADVAAVSPVPVQLWQG